MDASIVYHAVPKASGGMRFVDVWGVCRSDLESIRGVQIVIGPTSQGALTAMFKISEMSAGISDLEARFGASPQ
jgi:hypothetical protein